MRWYLNDLSIDAQFATAIAFVDALRPVVRLRERLPSLKSRLHCSRHFGQRVAVNGVTCREAIMLAASRDVKGVVLRWISRDGPFLEDDRQFEADDYFEFEGHDVTEQGLGEATRRTKVVR